MGHENCCLTSKPEIPRGRRVCRPWEFTHASKFCIDLSSLPLGALRRAQRTLTQASAIDSDSDDSSEDEEEEEVEEEEGGESQDEDHDDASNDSASAPPDSESESDPSDCGNQDESDPSEDGDEEDTSLPDATDSEEALRIAERLMSRALAMANSEVGLGSDIRESLRTLLMSLLHLRLLV